MKKILLDDKEVEKLAPESLPMLIHGEEGSGASLYTIALMAKWFSQGYKLHVLCGYSFAEEEFQKQIDTTYQEKIFFTKEEVQLFIAAIALRGTNDIVIIKNIELFDVELWQAISPIDHLIVSGDVHKALLKNSILQKTFTTKILFSPLDSMTIPEIKKYEGFLIAGDYKGVTKLE